MDYKDIGDLSYDVADEIINSNDFQALKKLKVEIDLKYASLIQDFKKAEAKYDEAKSYGLYHPDLKKRAKEFADIKIKLYNLEEVKEYKRLEKVVQAELDALAQALMKAI